MVPGWPIFPSGSCRFEVSDGWGWRRKRSAAGCRRASCCLNDVRKPDGSALLPFLLQVSLGALVYGTIVGRREDLRGSRLTPLPQGPR